MAEPSARRGPLTVRQELARKALHLATAVVPVGYALGVARTPLLALLVPLVVAAFAVELARHRIAGVRDRFVSATGALLRPHEHERWVGATWMLLSYVLAVWLLPRPVAIAATWAVAVGDAAAAVVGKSLGRVRLGRGGKTLEGAVACFVTTGAGALFVARLNPLESLVAAAAATLAEWVELPLDDNFRVAAAVAASVLATRYALAGS